MRILPNSKFSFTKKALESLPLPEGSARYSFKDERERGLIIRVTPKGQKTFQLYQKFHGRPVRVTLGTFPDMSVENARKEAQLKKAELTQGKNPNIEKTKFQQESTLKELFNEYMERYSKVQKKSWQYDEREINKFLSHWFNRKISTISKQEILKLHEKIHNNNGLYQANRILERLRGMYNKAIEWGWEGLNPTQGIKKFKEKSRDRFILPDEMPSFIKAVKEEHNEEARDFILMSLYCGARKTNTLQMRWEQIEWGRNIWRIPETKNGEPQDVNLSPQALEILTARKETKGASPWVFPSDSEAGHLADPKKAWVRAKQLSTMYLWEKEEHLQKLIQEVREAMPDQVDVGRVYQAIVKSAEQQDIYLPSGLMDVRLHDLRRTFGSYQAMAGFSLEIIGKTMNHKSPQSTAVYARLHNDVVRKSVEEAVNMMAELGDEAK